MSVLNNTDNEIILNKEANNNTNEKKNTMLKTLTKGPKILYNTTIGELKNGRIPLVDTGIRAFYRKSFNPSNTKGNEVFPKSEGYYRLGGKHVSRRKRKIKKRKNKNKRKNKTRKI